MEAGGRGQGGLVLDSVGNTTQQVGVGDGGAQGRGQLGDGQRKRARHGRQDVLLVSLIGNAGIRLYSVWRPRSNKTSELRATTTACKQPYHQGRDFTMQS